MNEKKKKPRLWAELMRSASEHKEEALNIMISLIALGVSSVTLLIVTLSQR